MQLQVWQACGVADAADVAAAAAELQRANAALAAAVSPRLLTFQLAAGAARLDAALAAADDELAWKVVVDCQGVDCQGLHCLGVDCQGVEVSSCMPAESSVSQPCDACLMPDRARNCRSRPVGGTAGS